MRVLVRADAGPERGTGHVMRCLTVAEAVLEAGHEAAFVGRIEGVPWLERHLDQVGIIRLDCGRDELPIELLLSEGADRLVVDSYWIDPALISAVDARIPTLAIVDHTTRGIGASWYLDQNLGAELRDWAPLPSDRLLLGSTYALVRRAIVAQRIERGWDIPGRESRVLAFMGGTDPARFMTQVVASIAHELPELPLTVVTTTEQLDHVRAVASSMPRATVLGPREDLPRLIGEADAVVSAAGTSAWDVCTAGRPAVLVGVVDNQSAGLAEALRRGIATGVDACADGADAVGGILRDLLDHPDRREELVNRANATFDGRGALRVAAAITAG